MLCGRLLLLFHYTDYGALRVLSTDVRLNAGQARAWQFAATPFVCLYVVGIPLAFAAILRYYISPVSRLHLACISPASRLHLACISLGRMLLNSAG